MQCAPIHVLTCNTCRVTAALFCVAEGQPAAQQVRLARVTGNAPCYADLEPPQFGLAEDTGIEMQDSHLWAPSQVGGS